MNPPTPALTTILSLSILAWTYKLSTVTRFARPKAPGERTTPARFLAASVGIMLAVLLLGVVGIFSQEATGNWNVALLGTKLSGIGTAAAAGIAFAIGCAFSIWFGDIAPGWWNDQIPTPFVGALLSAVIYAGFAVTGPAAVARLLPGRGPAPEGTPP